MTKVTRDVAKVTLLTDKESAVTAKDHQTGAIGTVRHSQGSEDVLFLDRVAKSKKVREDDLIVTAGLQQGKLPSFYPKGIPIGSRDEGRPERDRLVPERPDPARSSTSARSTP